MSSRIKSSKSAAKQQKSHRRSQSTTRKSGRIASGGDRSLARGLADALRGAKDDDAVAESYTHALHTYPARMHPATARALTRLCFEAQAITPRVVLDPFCGSGTTLVEARAAGLTGVGADLNPLAVKIARAKTWAPSKERLDAFIRVGHGIAQAALEEGKASRRADYQPRPWRVPKGVDKAARDAEITQWFAPHVRRELEFIAQAIDDLRSEDEEYADLLAVCLSSILIKASKRSSDTSSKLVQRTIARGAPARWFQERIGLLCRGVTELYKARQEAGQDPGSTKIRLADARTLGGEDLPTASVGAIISSPPYAGTYDYVDHHRLRMAFLGLPFDQFERGEIGARRRFKGRADEAMERVYCDFEACLERFHSLLVDGGLMVMMVGDSVAGVKPVWADRVLCNLSSNLSAGRFEPIAWASQERDKLGGLEKRAFGDEPKREHLVALVKK